MNKIEKSFMHKYFFAAVMAIVLCVTSANSYANDAEAMPFVVHGSFGYYLDSREFNTLSLQTRIEGLPWGVRFAGYTELHSAPDSGTKREDLRHSMSEYSLLHDGLARWTNIPGLGLEAEWVDGTPLDDDLGRLGVTYSIWIHPVDKSLKPGVITFRGFPYQTDGDSMQIGMHFNIPLARPLLVRGFAEYDIDGRYGDEWVVEAEFRYALNRQVGALLEFRHDGYADARGDDSRGVAIGLQLDY